MQAALLSSARMDWITPECVLERVRRVDGIALDPCTTADNPCGADVFYAPERGEDGLVLGWSTVGDGLVYANPPYGRHLDQWAARACLESARRDRETILLTPSRTDTKWWHRTFNTCQAVAFWAGRLTFEGAPAPAPFPSCLFYFGERSRRFWLAFADRARVIPGGGA